MEMASSRRLKRPMGLNQKNLDINTQLELELMLTWACEQS